MGIALATETKGVRCEFAKMKAKELRRQQSRPREMLEGGGRKTEAGEKERISSGFGWVQGDQQGERRFFLRSSRRVHSWSDVVLFRHAAELTGRGVLLEGLNDN